jgi:predicted dehydrogenase
MKLKVGVFGTGHMGKFHLNNWKEIEEVEITGFYDPDDAIAKEVEKKYQLKRFATPESLLEEIDIADIAAPTVCHYELCEKAIKKGKHVFVEKPLVATLDEGKRIIAMTKEAGVKVQVGHVERFNPAFTAAKKNVLNPMFIEAYRLSPFDLRETEVSVVQDLMVHDLDIILSLIKSSVRHVAASGLSMFSRTLDIANARIEFNNGCVANITASRVSTEKVRKMRLFQKGAYASIDFLEKKAELIQTNQLPVDKKNFSTDVLAPVSVANLPLRDTNAIKEELSAFVESIIHNKPLAVSEIDGYLAMETAQQIMDKININNTVSSY